MKTSPAATPAAYLEPARAAAATTSAPPSLGTDLVSLPPTQAERLDEAWSTVARRPKKKKSAEAMTLPAPPPKPTPVGKPKVKLPAAPNSAAVVVTLKPEAVAQGVDYRSVLQGVLAVVTPKGLAIEDLRLCKTATGTRIIEIPGARGQEKAAALALQLLPALADVYAMTRPVKIANVRFVGLYPSVFEFTHSHGNLSLLIFL